MFCLSHKGKTSLKIHKDSIMIPNIQRLFIIRRSPFIVILILSFLLTSCSDSGSTGPEIDPERPFIEDIDAELGERTQFIETNVADAAITDEDPETHTYTFNGAVLADADISLSAGDILFLEGKALRKIRTVTENNGEWRVETDFAGLHEAFKHADVHQTTTLDFTDTITEKIAIEYDGKLLKPNVAKANGGAWEYEFGDVTIEGSLETDSDKAVIAILVKYDTGDVTGAMKATATIENVQNETAFRIEDHETKSFRFHNPGLKGSVDIEFVMAGGNSSETSWEPPMPAVIIPFNIGPIPVVFKMGTVYVYQLDLGAEGTASLNTGFSYDGDLGFRVEDSEFTPMLDGGIKNPNASNAEGNAAGFGGTVTGQFGAALPKISFSMLGETVVPYLMQEFYVGASYTFPTCTKLFSRYEINTGIDMSLFGLASLNVSSNLVEEYPHDYQSDGCNGSKMADDMLHTISVHNNNNQLPGQPMIFRID